MMTSAYVLLSVLEFSSRSAICNFTVVMNQLANCLILLYCVVVLGNYAYEVGLPTALIVKSTFKLLSVLPFITFTS